MMLVDKPWPVTTRAPGPSSEERRQRTRTWPCASSPADTALISYSVKVGCQPRTGWSACVHRAEEGVDRAVAGRLGGPFLAGDRERDRAGRVAPVRRGHAPADELDRGRHLRGPLLDERVEVGVGDLLLGVGERHRLAVDLVESLALELVAELVELALEAAPPRQLADRQLAAGQSDRLRGHDLVGQRVLDDAVLVDPRFVGERVPADDRLVGLDREAGQVADQPAGGGQLLRRDTRAERRELGRSRAQGHDDLFERGVAGPLAEAVDRHLDLAGAGLDRGERVGRRQAQVVVAMDADRGLVADERDDALDERPELRRDGVADRVRDVDRRGTGLDDRLVDLEQVVDVGP